MNRTRDFYRFQRKQHILRKKRIIKDVYICDNYYSDDGKYSKNKIHCSCWMCRNKSYDSATNNAKRKAFRDIFDCKEMSDTYDLTRTINTIYSRTKHLKQGW